MTSKTSEPYRSRPADASWWRSAVIYQIYPRSFADGNGDGVGDLAGVRAHLDHLVDLGVDAVWFNPWYASPQADAGYDVADYRAIDPVFGTLAEAEDLIREAHALGLRIIVDVVPNHCSTRTLGSARRWRPDPVRPPGSVLVSARTRRPGRVATEQLAVHLRRTGMDQNHQPGWHPRRVVPAPVRGRTARPQLGEPQGTGGVRGRTAVLVRPRRRRRAHRFGRATHEGSRAPRLRPGPSAIAAPLHRSRRGTRRVPVVAGDRRQLFRAARAHR